MRYYSLSTITEVALTTGFCDQSYFIKQFEKIVGLTPYKKLAVLAKFFNSMPGKILQTDTTLVSRQ